MDYQYDAFITYRGSHDSAEAGALYKILQQNKLKTAIDTHEFSPAETFLDEMARCVRQSRYTIALISAGYTTSHYTLEEAIMQKILDTREQRRRLIVAYIEDVQAPLWMQSLVGVRLHKDKDSDSLPELKRLIRVLKLRGETGNAEHIEAINDEINLNLKTLPHKLLKYGIYGAATYGALSALANSSSEAAGLVQLEDATGLDATDITDSAASHVNETATGVVRTAAKTLKNIIDDLW